MRRFLETPAESLVRSCGEQCKRSHAEGSRSRQARSQESEFEGRGFKSEIRTPETRRKSEVQSSKERGETEARNATSNPEHPTSIVRTDYRSSSRFPTGQKAEGSSNPKFEP